MIRILSADDVRCLLDLEHLTDLVATGLIKQTHGAVERPDRPHYPVGSGIGSDEPLGTALVMPAYVHGATYFVTKLASVHDGNPAGGLPTVHAQLIINDAKTGQPRALMDGTVVTGARTGCIGAAATRALVDGALTLGVLGAGMQARWQTRAIDSVCAVDSVRIFSPSDSRVDCAADLRAHGIDAHAVDAPAAAVDGADVVVTATTSPDPVFPASALRADALVIAVGAYTGEMQEIESSVVEEAAAIYADVPVEVATIGDITEASIDPDVLIPLGSLLAGESEPPADGIILVESVGTAVLDAVTAEWLVKEAEATGIGQTVDL